MRTVGYYDTPFEAEIARGILESEDIEAMIQNENMGSVLPFGGAISSLRPYLVVCDGDFERAVEVLGRDAMPCADGVEGVSAAGKVVEVGGVTGTDAVSGVSGTGGVSAAGDRLREGTQICPECGNSELDFRFSFRGRPLGRLVSVPLFIFLLLTGSCPGSIRRGYHCRKCGSWS